MQPGFRIEALADVAPLGAHRGVGGLAIGGVAVLFEKIAAGIRDLPNRRQVIAVQEGWAGDTGLSDRADLQVRMRIAGVGVGTRLTIDFDVGIGIERRRTCLRDRRQPVGAVPGERAPSLNMLPLASQPIVALPMVVGAWGHTPLAAG